MNRSKLLRKKNWNKNRSQIDILWQFDSSEQKRCSRTRDKSWSSIKLKFRSDWLIRSETSGGQNFNSKVLKNISHMLPIVSWHIRDRFDRIQFWLEKLLFATQIQMMGVFNTATHDVTLRRYTVHLSPTATTHTNI